VKTLNWWRDRAQMIGELPQPILKGAMALARGLLEPFLYARVNSSVDALPPRS